MNIVFWGETHRSGTTANYTAMAGILPHLCPDRKIVCGSLQRERCEDSALFLWDAGVCSPAGQKQLLLTADLVVVNFEPQDYDGMEQFFCAICIWRSAWCICMPTASGHRSRMC